MSCIRHFEEVKNRSNTLGPSGYFKNGHKHGKAFPTLKAFRK